MKVYLFYGLPGSGKGTQRELFMSHLEEQGVSSLSLEMGQLLREYVKGGDSLKRKNLMDVMESGGLVPSVFPTTILTNKLMEQERDYDALLFDGGARKPIEAQYLVEFLQSDLYRAEIHAVLIDITEEEGITRLLKRGRTDDASEEVIRNRFAHFSDAEEGTAASLAYLRDHPDVTVHTIDGMGTAEEIHERVISEVGGGERVSGLKKEQQVGEEKEELKPSRKLQRNRRFGS